MDAQSERDAGFEAEFRAMWDAQLLDYPTIRRGAAVHRPSQSSACCLIAASSTSSTNAEATHQSGWFGSVVYAEAANGEIELGVMPAEYEHQAAVYGQWVGISMTPACARQLAQALLEAAGETQGESA